MRIFIDVGAHYGETARIALHPKWGFDRVYSVEPSKACLAALRRNCDPRLTIEPFALSNRNETATLHGSGLLGGSLYADKRQMSRAGDEIIKLVRASEWFSTLPEAEIYLKLNCEGGEADILDDLLDSGEIKRVTRAWIDFDIRKVPSQAHRQEELERRLKDAGLLYNVPGRFGFGPQHGVEAWLEWHCPMVPVPLDALLRYRLGLYGSPYDTLLMVLRRVLPRKLYWWLGHRFGRRSRWVATY